MPATDPRATFDLDQRPGRQVREVRPPFPLGMKPVFALQRRAVETSPEEQELRFELGRRHADGGVSKDETVIVRPICYESESMKRKARLTEESMLQIVENFSTEERVVPFTGREVSHALPLELSLGLFGRLARAATDQLCGDPATLSRYTIWAETVRGIILDAIESLDRSRQNDSVRRNLIRAANSLAAFATIEDRIDPLR